MTPLNKGSLFISDRAGAIYCSIPKTGRTNWKRLIQVFEGNYKTPLASGSKEEVHNLYYKTAADLHHRELE